ncbi:hypothetical protein TUMEXPCC7403_17015 [Tumidithrix helvetica PCC 7403]|uniref:hypothetical protein n=1 Tax=Tumidithrix helvetica TaxID=3457545 RepID=UPI003CAA8CD4
MPIKNPLNNTPIELLPVNEQPTIVVITHDPDTAPSMVGLMWFNPSSRRLWISKGVLSVNDWSEIRIDAESIDLAIFDNILVANGDVVTDGTNVILKG